MQTDKRARPSWILRGLGTIAMACLALSVWASMSDQTAGPVINSVGIQLPADAAPLEYQVLQTFQESFKYMDQTVTGYEVAYGAYLIAEPLLRVDRNFSLQPAAATRWQVSEDGLTWFFYIRPDLVFSDGRPITAHDYVNTFRLWADPKTAYDFEWYYRSIKHWEAVVSGQKPLQNLGVQALDEHTLAITTERPTPYLPALLTYSQLTPMHAIEKYGGAWSTRPETSISSGPYRLQEWSKGNQIILQPNPTYHGSAKPYLEKLVARLYSVAARPPFMAAYQNGEVDYIKITNQAELNRIKTDPTMKDQLNTYVDFITYYMTMDTYRPPFNDLRVRQAFSHAIDREALAKSALRGVGVPAHSMLQPNFPGANPEALASIQRFDPVLARQRLAEAGYPDGQGFPKLDVWLRNTPTGPVSTAAEAIQAMLKKTLNIDIGVRNMEVKVFMEALNSHQLPLALVPYGYDYLDASNQLDIWQSYGRHAWQNDRFEQFVLRGNQMVHDAVARTALYQEAERILVSDVGGIFLWYELANEMWKPYVRGEALEPNRWGNRAWRGNQRNLTPTLYITEAVMKDQESRRPRQSGDSFWQWLLDRR